ncbi:hypothetical protein GCM10009740_24930 [Terrabacter terrae]|uniref:AMIN-like domain-containing protein n=1 Tax=Terrabacter terrae TaxID=318434 RepID=A0ABN2UAL4_9MICO
MHTTTRRRLAAVGLVAALATPVAVSVATTSATAATSAAPYCGITWGSPPKATSPGNLWTGAVTGVRAGRHACYDRLVFDVAPGSGRLGYNVQYVDQLTGPGSGLPVPIGGGAKLQITVNAPSTVAATTRTFDDWRTFRQLKSLGSFEGYTDYGLGVRARLPMRVFVLTDTDGGRRLVIDVAHRW